MVSDNDGRTDMTQDGKVLKKAISLEGFVFLVIFIGFFGILGSIMGGINLINTLMNTAFDLLINTVFYIMAIAVLMGAISELLMEFGIVSMANKAISPIIEPVYDLPGASVIGIFATYFSDNPAILPLAKNDGFKGYFKKYQFYGLTNLGTSFGMGLIISAFIVGIDSPIGESFVSAVVIGNIGAIIGSIVSTRLMLNHTKKIYGTEAGFDNLDSTEYDIQEYREIRSGGYFSRVLSAALEGGVNGVQMGMDIIPGVVVICTLVQVLTAGPGAEGVYTGAAYEGVAFFPYIGGKLKFIIQPLFGFENPEAIAVPITALGAAGAAIGLIPNLVQEGLANANNLAVFTAMCMCWSGYLSTHIAMMDSLGESDLAGKAILYHTIGGIAAGVSANLLFKLII